MEVQPRTRDDADGDPGSAQLGARTAAPTDGPGGAGRIAGDGGADGTRPDAARDAGALARTGQDQRAGQDQRSSQDPGATSDQQKAARAKAAQEKAAREQAEKAEKAGFERAAQQIRDAVRADPTLAVMATQIAIDMTPEGLRIQLMDEDHTPMFPSGSASLNDRARLVLQKIAPILAKMPEPIAISGHTDAAPYRGGERSNWELSSERANATRRLLVDAGLPETRFRSVSGNADRDLLLPADPFAAANRRIAIVALRNAGPSRP